MYDLLIQGGRVIDPARKIDAEMDVAVGNGKVVRVAPAIPPADALNVIDASGRLVVPGLIDLHTHVYHGFLNNGADPDLAGVNQGVTTVVDGGSAGHAIFAGFPNHVIPAARTSVYCFLHIGSFGLAVMPELWYPEEINTDATKAVILNDPELIRGVKIRLVGKLVARDGIAVVKTAQQTAKKCQLPLMIHIGDRDCRVSSSLTREVLSLLEAGDIVSHFYTAHCGGLLGDDRRAMPELIKAIERGVLLDVANGVNNCAYSVAREMLEKGVSPYTLSTDVTRSSLNGPVYGLTVTMSRFLELGLSLDAIVSMTTINPARAIRIDDRKGSLKPGMDADISILEIRPGSWQLPDSHQQVLNVTRLIRPVMTIKAGVPIPPKCIPVS